MTKYPLSTRLIHWFSAVLIVFLFVSGWFMVDLDYYSPWYQTLPDLHQLIGVIVLLLWFYKILRIFWVQSPPSLSTLKPYERLISFIVKLLFYLLVLSLCITGYLMATAGNDQHALMDIFTLPTLLSLSSGWLDSLGSFHEYMAYTIMILFTLHLLAALKHHFIDKDDTLRRMI